MRQSGELVQWNDERGFGFIAAPDLQRVFVHVSAIEGMATRPRQGDRLSFTTRLGREGRLEASNVKIAQANPRPSRETLQRGLPSAPRRPEWQAVAAAGLAGLLSASLLFGRLPLWLAVLYLAMGGLSFVLYGADKAYAKAGQWRIGEVTLLGIDLGCGVIGGLLAQVVFRHKTRKRGYILQSALITIVHAIWLAGLAGGLIDAAGLAALVGG